MIVEGIVTTENTDGSINLAPMGPIVDEACTEFLFRPYQSSTTFQNLKRKRSGVFQITDNVYLIAQAAIGKLNNLPEMKAASVIDGKVICDVCHWYEFEVDSIDDSNPRSEITVKICHTEVARPFLGFNRAKHAVLEVAIASTRIGILEDAEIITEFERARSPILKTAGSQELKAFEMLIENAKAKIDFFPAELSIELNQ